MLNDFDYLPSGMRYVAIHVVLSCAMFLILAGCTDVTGEGLEVVSAVTGGAVEQEKIATAVPIEAFDRLSDLIERAVAAHPSIAASAASLRAAEADARSAGLRRLPSVSLESRLLDSAGGSAQVVGIIDQPIWTGGQISAGIDQGRARLGAAIATCEEASVELALLVSQSYFDAYRWHERTTILEQSVGQHNDLVALIERRYEQSATALADVELARSRVLQMKLQLDRERAQGSAAMTSLRQLTGDPLLAFMGSASAPRPWPEFTQALVVSRILAVSPRLERLRQEVKSLSAEAVVAKASLFPQVSAQYTVDGASGGKAGVLLKFQTGGGFSHIATAEAANSRVDAGEAQVALAEQQLRERAIILLSQYDSAVSQVSGSQSSAGLSQRVMDAYMRQFGNGRKTWLDVMNAMREATNAEADAAEVRILALSSLANILILSGQWSPLPSQECRL